MKPALLLLLLVACISTQATHLAGFDPARAPTCSAAIKVYASADQVGAPFVEIAYLNAKSTDPVSDDQMIQSMKEKAVEVGANGMLLRGIRQVTGEAGLVTGAFTGKPVGEATAHWIPRDSAATLQTCIDNPDQP